MAVNFVLLIESNCKVHRWDVARSHDLHTKFHKDWFRHLKVIEEGYI
jgi:hypothetical protein